MPRRRFNTMAQTFERIAAQRAGNTLQAPVTARANQKRLANNMRRRRSNGGNGG